MSPYPVVPGPWWRHVLLMLLLILVTAALYSPAVGLGFFTLDDSTYVTANPMLRALTVGNLRRILTEPYTANYSPMHLLSYALDRAVGGLDPRLFHLSSHLWAGLAAAFVYLVTLCLLGRPLVALAAGALFAVHPAHVEAVAWISNRKDLVAAAFALPAFAAYLRYRRRTRRPWGWYAASLVLFLLAVAGKQSVVVLPAILLAFDFFVEKRWNWGMLLDKLPFAVIAGLFALRTMGAQPTVGRSVDFFAVGYGTILNIRLLLGLAPYVIYRSLPPASAFGAEQCLVITLPLLLLVLPFLLCRRLPGMVAASLYWMILALMPPLVLTLFHPVSDRYLFFPSVGLVLLAAFGLDRALRNPKRGTRIAAAAVAGALALFWAGRTVDYLLEWRDPRSVWYAATGKSGDLFVWQYLGTHYADEADRLDAVSGQRPEERQRSKALAAVLWAGDPRLQRLFQEWEGISAERRITKEYQQHLRTLAWTAYEEALRRKGARLTSNLLFRRGKVKMDLGETEAAKREFERALAEARRLTDASLRNEGTVLACQALAVAAWDKKDYKTALKWYDTVDEEQRRCGQVFVPDVDKQRERLRMILHLK